MVLYNNCNLKLINTIIFVKRSFVFDGNNSSIDFRIHFDCLRYIQISPTTRQKTGDDDDDGEKMQFIMVKAPPGAADTTVPGKLEWEKTVGTHVNAGEVVCRIRFKDGRTLDIPAPLRGVIAVRKKNEGEPVHHSEELFKIRLDSDDRKHGYRKMKKKTKIFDSEDAEETESSLVAKAGISGSTFQSPNIPSSQEDTKQGKDTSYKKQDNVKPDRDEETRGTAYPSRTKQSSGNYNSTQNASSNHTTYTIQSSFQSPLHGLNASLMTSMEEINMANTIEFYEKHDKLIYPDRPSFRTFYIKAAAFVLSMKPSLNIKILNNEVIQKKTIDVTIGFTHLKVMVFHTFKDANKIPYMDVTRILQGIKKQVAEGTYKANRDKFHFTISQEWEKGSVFGTPRYSETCTLGLHKIIKRPIVVENTIAAYPMMYASLTYNNSIISEDDAILFLKMFKLALEEPRYILINSI